MTNKEKVQVCQNLIESSWFDLAYTNANEVYESFRDKRYFEVAEILAELINLVSKIQDVLAKEDKSESEAYKRGWRDALSKALEEARTIHSEEGIFQIIQAETLIGLRCAIDESEDKQ